MISYERIVTVKGVTTHTALDRAAALAWLAGKHSEHMSARGVRYFAAAARKGTRDILRITAR